MAKKNQSASGEKANKSSRSRKVGAKASAPVVKGEAPKPEVKEKDLKKATSVDIWHGNIYIRTYSEDVHGEDFLALAKEFLAKHPKGHMLPSDEVPEVVVNYREKEDAELPLDKQDPGKPFVDKTRRFADKEAAVAFNIQKKGTIVRAK